MSTDHIPHEICLVLESANGLTGKGEVLLRVGSQKEENEWVRVLSPSFPLYQPLGSYYLLSLEEGFVVEELELRIDLLEKSYGAAVKLRGEVKTRGRVQLYNEKNPSDVILITVAVLIRVLPLTPREYREATTQTLATKRNDRLVQTTVDRQNATTWTSPQSDDVVMTKEEDEEERRREVAEIVEKTIKRRLMIEDGPTEERERPKSLSEEVVEMRRSLRLLGKEERMRREKGDPPKETVTVPLTPPESPSTSSSSSSSESSSSSSSKSGSTSTSSTSSSSESSSSSSTSSKESIKPNLSPTSAYIKNLREKIISEQKISVK